MAYKTPTTPCPTSFPALQGMPGDSTSVWLNQRQLGRHFGLNGNQMGRELTQLRWKDPSGAPSAACLAAGQAKKVVKTSYVRYSGGETLARPNVEARWHAKLAVEGLKALGLSAVSQEKLLAHSVTDVMATAIKTTVLRNKNGGNQGGLSIEDQLIQAKWVSGRLADTLERVPPAMLGEVLLAVQQGLVERKFKPEHIRSVFRGSGFLPHLKTEELERAWEEPLPATPRRSRL